MTRVAFHTAADAIAAAPAVRAHLDAGGIIAYPTETVYGFGCALTPSAMASLAVLKARDAAKPVLLLAADPQSLPGLLWTPAARFLATAFWPGPLTIAVAAIAGDAGIAAYPPPVLSQAGTVAVRQSPLPALRALLDAIDIPITSTSANLTGDPPAFDADAVAAIVTDLDILVLDGGPIPATLPSTVVDCSVPAPRLIREGAISRRRLHDMLTTGGFAFDG